MMELEKKEPDPCVLSPYGWPLKPREKEPLRLETGKVDLSSGEGGGPHTSPKEGMVTSVKYCPEDEPGRYRECLPDLATR